jgi:hypothetical protein
MSCGSFGLSALTGKPRVGICVISYQVLRAAVLKEAESFGKCIQPRCWKRIVKNEKQNEKTNRGRTTMQMQKGRGRGFASMSPEKKREIASKGGKAAHSLGTAHKWTSEEAQAAGRKGGSISRRRPKSTVQA